MFKNNETGGKCNDGIIGELFKNSSKGMANLLKVLNEVVWTEGSAPKQHRQGLIVKIMVMLRTRVITEALHGLLSVIGKLFCKKSRSNQTRVRMGSSGGSGRI